ncbi:MAG: BamA/TamA family outer membrane protein [Janthinobacterium lividum]
MKPSEQQSKHRQRLPLGVAAGLALALVAGLLLAVGCSPLRLLGPKQRLLTKVTVLSHGLSTAQQERLLTLVQQKPNRNIPLPKLAIYQLGHSFYDSARIDRKAARIRAHYADELTAAGTDSAKIGKLVARRDTRLARKQTALEKGNAIMRLGEPPVIYNPALSQSTNNQLTTYLRSQGYFRAAASYTDSAHVGEGFIGVTMRTLGLRHRPAHYVPLRDSAGQRLHRRVAVTYTVQEGLGFRLGKLENVIPDAGVAALVAQMQEGTLLHPGDAYNEDLIGQERARLEAKLKNAGYYDFRAQFISFEADTSFEKGQVRLKLLIASPPGGHRRYQLRQVVVLTDASRARALRAATGDTARLGRQGPASRDSTVVPNGTGRISTANMPAGVTPAAVADSLAARRLRQNGGRRLAPRDTVRLDSVDFASRGPLQFSPKVLARQIALRPGQLYNVERTQRTQRQLSNLDMFQFNTVSYRKVAGLAADSTGSGGNNDERPLLDQLPQAVPGTAPNYLDAIITTSPSPRFSETTEFGGTYVAGLPGPFANLRLKWRNPFGGAEVLELSGRVGFEGQLARLGNDANATTDAVYTTQYGVTAALIVPQFLVPFGLNRFFRNAQPRTRFSLSDTYTSTPYYTRANAEFTFDYIWQPSAYQQYVFTPVDASLVNALNTSQFYKDLLNTLRYTQGSPLYQSFRSVYEPSISFTSIYNSNDLNQTRNAHYLRLFAEVGGLTRGLYRNTGWFEDTGLQVYNFVKIAADYRRYYKLTPLTYLAWRLNGGVAHALTRTPDPDQPGVESYTIPYDKYFFAGGSNSVRAWSPRRLGTGSYATHFTTGSMDRDYYTEQPGELLLEGSLEYRFPVYSFIKGAFFTDFGNVWTLQPDTDRRGAEFRFDSFYKQFAVGSGIGIRMDFTFLILRFDIATKVYDPTETDDPWRIKNALRQTNNQTVVNIGIGYPF